LPKYEYCRYRKILGNTGNTSIADTGRFWKILVIPVLQILEDSGKYQYFPESSGIYNTHILAMTSIF
jgi:hypothetical protein